MNSNPQDVAPMIKIYKKLFVYLSIITLIGIAIAVLHMPVWILIVAGLIFIVTKSVIVYELFKNLLVGRNLIVITFVLTAIVVVGLLILPVMNHHGYLVGTEDTSKALMMEQPQEETSTAHGH